MKRIPNTMKARYFILLVFASVYSFAQNQIYSEDELKEGFYIQQPAWESDCLLDSLDRYCDGTMEYQEDGKVSIFHTPKQISNLCLAEEGMHPANGHFMHGGKLNQAIGAIDKARVKKLSYDGVASNKNDFVPAELQSRKALALFAHNINDCIDTSLIPKGMNKEYAVMLYLDDNSKAHLRPLLPRELTDEDKLVLGLLSAAVHQQSDGTFQGYWSGKGYFNAIYLKATFQHNGWAFEDYKYTSKP